MTLVYPRNYVVLGLKGQRSVGAIVTLMTIAPMLMHI